MISVICSWDGGNYYPPEYVNKLYNAVKRNMKQSFKFLLYAGDKATFERCRSINPDIMIVRIGLPWWWNGMHIWRPDPPGVDTERILYLDIDQVIVGSLDEIADYPSDHACMKDYPEEIAPLGNRFDVNVSVTVLKTGARTEVWERYVAAGSPQWSPFDYPKSDKPLPLGAQTIINHGVKVDLLPEEWCQSYKLHFLRTGALATECKVCCFHGRPKPHEVTQEFVKENWI